MIEASRQHEGIFEIYCDGKGCSESREIEAEDFDDFLYQAKNVYGYRSVKNEDGDWENLCRVCGDPFKRLKELGAKK